MSSHLFHGTYMLRGPSLANDGCWAPLHNREQFPVSFRATQSTGEQSCWQLCCREGISECSAWKPPSVSLACVFSMGKDPAASDFMAAVGQLERIQRSTKEIIYKGILLELEWKLYPTKSKVADEQWLEHTQRSKGFLLLAMGSLEAWHAQRVLSYSLTYTAGPTSFSIKHPNWQLPCSTSTPLTK